MSTAKFRPTFRVPSPLEAGEIMKRVQHGLQDHADNFTGQVKRSHAMISIVDSKRHFWSPWLHLEIREEDSSQQLFGRFSPHPSIWTAFMFSYLALAVLFFFSIVFGLSQQLAGQAPTGYYALAVWTAIAILLWFISQAGQKLAREEMESMKQMIEKSLDQVANDHQPA